MKKFIDITDRKILNHYLSGLHPGAIPLWGSMTPLQLVEHLVTTIEYTNGKKQTSCNLPVEEADKKKQSMIYSDAEMPMGIKTPVKKTDPPPVRFPNLTEAVKALNTELDAFEEYFSTPGITSVHPGFGELNYQEWLVFHGKHFSHHFKQFDLIRLSELQGADKD